MKAFFQLVILCGIFGFSTIANAEATQEIPEPNSDIRKPAGIDGLVREKDEEVRTKLSTLWTVVAFNMIGADVLSSYIPGRQEEVVEFAGGEENVKYFMLGGAIIYEIPISMIFLSKYMPRNASRWVNVGAAALSAITIVGGGSLEPHYIFAAGAEILTLSYITWTALTWPDAEKIRESRHGLGVSLKSDRSQLSYSYKF